MPRQFKPPREMFETRSEAWERVGLSVDVNQRLVKRSRRETMVLLPLLIALVIAYDRRYSILGWTHVHRHQTALQRGLETPVQIAVALALVAIGWALARAASRFVGPTFLRRMDPATAGTFGFLIRLLTIILTIVVALGIAGVQLQALVVGGGFTAVIVGLAAQQTLGNAIAGMVLLSARPFRVGERVRFQAGAVGGTVEGIVSSLGLLYTTLSRGADRVMIPNNVVLAAVVVPLREPDAVDVKVRLTSGVRPTQVQAILEDEVSIPTSYKGVHLEEVDGDDVVVRVRATPEIGSDGPRLADEIMTALSSVTGEHAVSESH